MKKIKVIVLLFIVIILSGCTVESNITMDAHGKVTEEVNISEKISKLGNSKEESEDYIKDVLDNYKLALNARDYNTEIVTKNDKSSAIITNNYDSIINYFEDTVFSQYIYRQMKWNETDEYYEIYNVTDHINYCPDCSEWPRLPLVKINITLPVSAIENNADEINGNTYTWVYDKNTPSTKKFYLKISKQELKNNEIIYNKKEKQKKEIKKTVTVITVLIVGIIVSMYGFYLYKKAQKNKFDY